MSDLCALDRLGGPCFPAGWFVAGDAQLHAREERLGCLIGIPTGARLRTGKPKSLIQFSLRGKGTAVELEPAISQGSTREGPGNPTHVPSDRFFRRQAKTCGCPQVRKGQGVIMTILIHQHGALVLSTLVLGLTVTAMDLTAQETVPSLLPGDRLRVYEVPPDSASSRVNFQPYSDDSIEGTAASRLGFEAKLDRIAGDTLVLSPLQSALIPRRVSLSNIERLEVQRSKRDLRVLWGLGYGTAVGAFLGFGGREQEGDEFLAAMTAWGAAVGVATAALARAGRPQA